MATVVVDSPKNEQAKVWWFLDTLVVEHRSRRTWVPSCSR